MDEQRMKVIMIAAEKLCDVWDGYSDEIAANNIELDGWSHLETMITMLRLAVGAERKPPPPEYVPVATADTAMRGGLHKMRRGGHVPGPGEGGA